jgi:hypothetical protein
MAVVNKGIYNNYSIKPSGLTEYNAFRGVTDFTQIGQFDQFETGYSFLSVIQMPEFMKKIAEQDQDIANICDAFQHMLEYEFRGLEGLPDIQGETYNITDGINEQQLINKVTMDTSVTISSNYFERRGGLITKFSEYYLTGIKDRISQAKTYHGLIANNKLHPSLKNEVFTMMYMVTDNTMLRLERAVLLCNCQLTKAETSIYNSTRGEINNKEMTIEWNCFPIMGYQVDKAAKKLLEDITDVKVDYENKVVNYKKGNKSHDPKVAVLDSNDYLYGIMDANNKNHIDKLSKAIG